MMRTYLMIVLGWMVAMPLAAQAEEKMLGVGDEIPAGFTAIDSLERPVTYKSLAGENGLVLLFTRSADWCQYCKTQIVDWNAHVDEVKEKGYKLAAISYDTPAKLQEFSDKNMLKYTLLSDKDSAMIKAFGILNTKFASGSRFYGIPNPAIYVIDADGKITHVFREDGYVERPQVNEVLSALGGEGE